MLQMMITNCLMNFSSIKFRSIGPSCNKERPAPQTYFTLFYRPGAAFCKTSKSIAPNFM